MITLGATKKSWEMRRLKFGASGVSEEGLISLRKNQVKTNLGKSPSEETKGKISEAQKGKPRLYARKPCSDEKKSKISLAQKGKPRLYLRGRKRPPFSKEWRRKISESRKGIVVDRSKHDARIMAEVARLRAEGYKVIPSGLWKFPVPDLVKVKDGGVTAVEIELSGHNGSRLENKVKKYKEYFDSVDVIN
jgi:hypothetical protein